MNIADYLPIPCSQDAIYETIASVNRFTRSGVNRFNAMPTCVKVAAIAIPLIWALGAALNAIYGEDDQEPGIFSYCSQLFNYGGLTKEQVDDFWKGLENEEGPYIIPAWDLTAVIRPKTLPAALNRAWGENFLQYRDLVLKICNTSGNDNACGLFCINGQKINGCYQYPGDTPGAAIRQDFAKDFWARIDDPKVFSKFCDVVGKLYKDFNNPVYKNKDRFEQSKKVMEPLKENEAYKTYQKHVMDSPFAKEQARTDFFKSLYENRSSFCDDFIDKINQGRYGKALSKTPDADKEEFLRTKRLEITNCDDQKRFKDWMVGSICSLADECSKEGIEVNGISWPEYKRDFLDLQKELLKSDEDALKEFASNKEVQQSYCNMIQESNYQLIDMDVQFAATVFRKRVYIIADGGVHSPFGDTEGEEIFVHNNNGSNHYSRCEPTQRMKELMSTHDDSSDETSSQGSLDYSPPRSTGSSPVIERRDDSTAPIVNIDIENLRHSLQSNEIDAIIVEDKTEADKTCSLHALYGVWVDRNGKTSNGVQVISRDTGKPVIGPILVYPDGGAKGARDFAVNLLRKGIAENDEIEKMYIEDFALWIQAMKGGDVIADNMLGSATTAPRVIDLQAANEEALNQQRNARNSISAIIYRQRDQLPEYAKQLLIASSGKGSQEEFEEAIDHPENGIGVFGNWFNQCKNNIIEALKSDGRWSDTLEEIESLQDCIDDCYAKQDQQLKELALEQRIIEKYLTHAINHVDVELNNTQLKMLALSSGIHLILIQKEGSDFSVSEVGKGNSIQRIVYLRSGHYARAHLNEKYAENLNQDGVYNTLLVLEEEEE